MVKRIFLILVLTAECIAVFVLATGVIVYFKTQPYIYDSSALVPNADAVLIPGASLTKEGKPAPIFADRIDAALELYESGKVNKFLVSGDNGTVGHNEVDPVRIYLLEKGVPDADIFLDHAGFDTYSTMYRANAIFRVPSVIVTSQSFHLPRAIFIARRLGIDAYGVNADKGHILFGNYSREVLANVKAVLDLALGRTPRFLGAAIPITGTTTPG